MTSTCDWWPPTQVFYVFENIHRQSFLLFFALFSITENIKIKTFTPKDVSIKFKGQTHYQGLYALCIPKYYFPFIVNFNADNVNSQNDKINKEKPAIKGNNKKSCLCQSKFN